MKQKHQAKPREQNELALERINILFAEAASCYSNDPALSNRYMDLAIKLATRYRVRLPKQLKQQFCKTCQTYLRPAVNCTIRLRSGKICYHCQNCGNVMRYPFKARQAVTRSVSS
jgi:ribonuclease P protein subunit RPR2